MPSNTVPVYRHGRKFYVSIEEYERMRAEEKRHRRTQMHKAQNLPIPKSHQTYSRTPSSSYYNPIHRSASNPHDYRQGVPRLIHISPNTMLSNDNRQASNRPSRATSRYNDNRNELRSAPTMLPIRLPTTALRSNSSDKVLELRRTPQTTQTSYNGYVADDYAVKRSLSAEMVGPEQIIEENPQIPNRRQVSNSTFEYETSSGSKYPPNYPEKNQPTSNSSKLNSYLQQVPISTLDSTRKPLVSEMSSGHPTYDADPAEPEYVYNVRSSFSQQNGNLFTPRSPATPAKNQYYVRDVNIGSYSDDNSSSPPPFIQRRNTDRTRYRRADLLVETDDDYEGRSQAFLRPAGRSQSNDRLMEKKRVRFADTEGLTLERSADREQIFSQQPNPQQEYQQDRATDYRLYTRDSHHGRSNDSNWGNQPFMNSYYQMSGRAGKVLESKLATDV